MENELKIIPVKLDDGSIIYMTEKELEDYYLIQIEEGE